MKLGVEHMVALIIRINLEKSVLFQRCALGLS